MNAGAFSNRGRARAARTAIALAVVLIFTAAAVFSLRLAWADAEFRRGTEESVARAVRILPDNVQYLLFHALQMEYAGADSTAELERAAALSPLSSAPRLRLGLAAESAGNLGKAEKWLLEAARVDHQFEPRWALANFYFRRERPDDFWKWMRAALAVSYGDRRAAFDLCWRVSGDAGEILRRGVPDQQPDVLRAMLAYVFELHPEAAGVVAEELAKVRDPRDAPFLDAACGTLIAAGDADRAAQLWIAAGHSPAGGVWNGDFGSTPSGAGFDWQLEKPPGVTIRRVPGEGLRVELSGRQPETVRLLREIVLLDAGRRYRLGWTVRTDGLPEITGFGWRVGDRRFPLKASEAGDKDSVVLDAPKRLTSLELWYERPGGQVPAEGWLEIREVELAPVP